MEREDRRRIKEKGREKIRQRWMVKKEEKVRKRKKGRAIGMLCLAREVLDRFAKSREDDVRENLW